MHKRLRRSIRRQTKKIRRVGQSLKNPKKHTRDLIKGKGFIGRNLNPGARGLRRVRKATEVVDVGSPNAPASFQKRIAAGRRAQAGLFARLVAALSGSKRVPDFKRQFANTDAAAWQKFLRR